MNTITRKDLNIKAHMNFTILVLAKEPIRFVHMTVDDDVFEAGAIVPHEGPQYFFKRETAEAVRDRFLTQGLKRTGIDGRYIVAKPHQIEVVIMTIDEYLNFLETRA